MLSNSLLDIEKAMDTVYLLRLCGSTVDVVNCFKFQNTLNDSRVYDMRRVEDAAGAPVSEPVPGGGSFGGGGSNSVLKLADTCKICIHIGNY